MASEPKLWAVFDPDGKLVIDPAFGSNAAEKKWKSWGFAGFSGDAAIRRAKRAGYTCREVRIVPVEEVAK